MGTLTSSVAEEGWNYIGSVKVFSQIFKKQRGQNKMTNIKP